MHSSSSAATGRFAAKKVQSPRLKRATLGSQEWLKPLPRA